MSEPRPLTHEQYAKRLHEIVYPRLPDDIDQRAIVVAWLSWLQQREPYDTFLQLGSQRQQHFFAVVGGVSFDNVPLILPTADQLFHHAAQTFTRQQEALRHVQVHAVERSRAAHEPAARSTSSPSAPASPPSVFQEGQPFAAPPRPQLPPGPIDTITNNALYDINPLARRPTNRPPRHNPIPPPPNEP
ncbi:uncharacterized protein RHOBADRAFT_43006 [Rhodotorula graminis WP1]|uniref:Uncharacterized protein n=1 Tax=Rhodotorula graminis (strain WP1) TaxID=578459 RepID=A0A194SB77_RHOGW|nr:uncharacterized protein RHOBADRAFT_43006 [Rhodotorula graminis WP1]KPV76661.1 hypothetical protein RHOBADRAFT_43006 [Rhodotorula graminis WP1]